MTPYEAGERTAIADFKWLNDIPHTDAELDAWNDSLEGGYINDHALDEDISEDVQSWWDGYNKMQEKLGS